MHKADTREWELGERVSVATAAVFDCEQMIQNEKYKSFLQQQQQKTSAATQEPPN